MFSRFRNRYGTFRRQTPEEQTPAPEASTEKKLITFQTLVKSDDGCQARCFEWESRASPWKLLATTLGKVGKSIPALVLLWWTMGYRKEQLMKCDGRIHAIASVCLCEYTKAFIRVFPLLAINICAGMVMKLVLQERIYYGLLRAGALLDFENADPKKNLQLWLLVVSLMHGVCHFILKFYTSKAWKTIGWEDDRAEIKAICQVFLVPSFLFIMLFVSAADVEAVLIPLNKFFEEDVEIAPKMLGCLNILEEKQLSSVVQRHDFIAKVQGPPTIRGVYDEIIRAYPKLEEEEKGPVSMMWEVWPAILLVDLRLKDDESSAFRRMFAVLLGIIVFVHAVTIAILTCHALKDLLLDFMQGQREDIIPFFVLSSHAILIGWLFARSFRNGQFWRLWTAPKH
mmetsp:Transcript_11903/g.23094  ORF Transcript_11903/g.23094 Transcript_11903/m.23094 type:complete len:398 (-) Transcript_11903:71-1264(-)